MQNRLRRVLFVARLRVVTRTANYVVALQQIAPACRLVLLCGKKLRQKLVCLCYSTAKSNRRHPSRAVPAQRTRPRGTDRARHQPDAQGLPGQRQVLWGSKRRPVVRTSVHDT